MKITIATDYTKKPGGRFKKQGEGSGEEFRDNILIPKYKEAIANDEILEIDFDGCYAFPPSFLEESFGGLVREIRSAEILKNINLICDDEPSIITEIMEMMDEAIKMENIKR